jgi:hypothetical protein
MPRWENLPALRELQMDGFKLSNQKTTLGIVHSHTYRVCGWRATAVKVIDAIDGSQTFDSPITEVKPS